MAAIDIFQQIKRCPYNISQKSHNIVKPVDAFCHDPVAYGHRFCKLHECNHSLGCLHRVQRGSNSCCYCLPPKCAEHLCNEDVFVFFSGEDIDGLYCPDHTHYSLSDEDYND